MKGHMANNIMYGPWQSAAYFKDLREAALDMMAGLDPDDDLIIQYWPKIMQDKGLQPAIADTREARAHWLATLSEEECFKVKGPKSSPSRFFSWNHATRFHDAYWHTETVVMLYLAIRRGWVTDCSEVAPGSRFATKNDKASIV